IQRNQSGERNRINSGSDGEGQEKKWKYFTQQSWRTEEEESGNIRSKDYTSTRCCYITQGVELVSMKKKI
ncbi:hypothetical protein OS493_038071, partial [Desmophyllum pertusum]